MRYVITLIFLLFPVFSYATTNCVTGSNGTQLCLGDNGALSGTSSNGSPLTQNGCVSASGGSVCYNADGTMSGTDASGNPIAADYNNCAWSSSGFFYCSVPDPSSGSSSSGSSSSSSSGSDGAQGDTGQNGTGSTSNVNISFDFLTPIYTAINGFCSWLLSLIPSFFTTIFTLLKDFVCWSFDEFLKLVEFLLNQISMQSINGLLPQAFQLPSEILNTLGLLGFSDCMVLLLFGLTTRMILQLIPFVRLGS